MPDSTPVPDSTPTPDTLRAAVEAVVNERPSYQRTMNRLTAALVADRAALAASPAPTDHDEAEADDAHHDDDDCCTCLREFDTKPSDDCPIHGDPLAQVREPSPAPTDSPDEQPCTRCLHPWDVRGAPRGCLADGGPGRGFCGCTHDRPAAVTAPRAHRQGDPHDPAGCTACQDSGARLTASSHGFPRSVADALRAVDEGWSGGWPAEVLAAEYARPAAVTAPREDEVYSDPDITGDHLLQPLIPNQPARWADFTDEQVAAYRAAESAARAAAAPAVERATPPTVEQLAEALWDAWTSQRDGEWARWADLMPGRRAEWLAIAGDLLTAYPHLWAGQRAENEERNR